MSTLVNEEFAVVSVEPSEPPADMIGTGWHCYIIEQGKNTIRGYKRGDIESVREAVDEIVECLNQRRYGKSGRAHPTLSSRAKKTGAE